MHTDVFSSYQSSMNLLLGHINALDLYLNIAGGECKKWKDKKGVIIQAPGLHPEEAKKHNELFGVIQFDASEADSLISFVMLTVCKNAMVSLIAVTEVYLQDIYEWIFDKRPDVFKSNNELKFTHKDIIECGNYETILARLRSDILSDLSRDNVGVALHELFTKKCRWDITHLDSSFISLKDASTIRNIIVHNQSRVNQIFLRYISDPENYTLGKDVVITPSLLKTYSYDTYKLIGELDSIAWSKCNTP